MSDAPSSYNLSYNQKLIILREEHGKMNDPKSSFFTTLHFEPSAATYLGRVKECVLEDNRGHHSRFLTDALVTEYLDQRRDKHGLYKSKPKVKLQFH